MSQKLSGDRNQCQACKEFFNSTFAFDKHRTGAFGKDRRCLTVEEMRDKGMDKNAAGFWISSAMPADIRDAEHQEYIREAAERAMR